MLCLSGFELYSRWVPLLCHHKFVDLFAKSSFREIRTNKTEIFLRMFMASRVIKNP